MLYAVISKQYIIYCNTIKIKLKILYFMIIWNLYFSQFFKNKLSIYYNRFSFLHFSYYILLRYVNNTTSWFTLLNGNSDSFQFLNIINNAIMNTPVHISLGTCGHFSGKHNCRVIMCISLFNRDSEITLQWAMPIYKFANSESLFPLPHALPLVIAIFFSV